MKSYYCLITSDSKHENAFKIFKKRIEEKKYPLYLKTPHLNEIKEKDQVVFYIAGKQINSQTFVACAEVSLIDDLLTTTIDPDKNTNLIVKYLTLEKIFFFKYPKKIKLILNELGFIKNIKHYGVNLVGGVTKISHQDFIKIKYM